jgi:hypothetical protein
MIGINSCGVNSPIDLRSSKVPEHGRNGIAFEKRAQVAPAVEFHRDFRIRHREHGAGIPEARHDVIEKWKGN